MNEFEVIPAFSSPIFNSHINFIGDEELKYIQNLKFNRTALKNGWITRQNNLLYDEELIELKKKIEERFNFFKSEILKIKEEFYICDSWAIKHKKNDFSQIHNHSNSIFSGILYLDVDESSGKIIFEDTQHETFNLSYSQWNIYNSKSWEFLPKRGQILIFPSKVNHLVMKSESRIERLALAFNFFLTKYSSNSFTSRLEFNNENGRPSC